MLMQEHEGTLFVVTKKTPQGTPPALLNFCVDLAKIAGSYGMWWNDNWPIDLSDVDSQTLVVGGLHAFCEHWDIDMAIDRFGWPYENN